MNQVTTEFDRSIAISCIRLASLATNKNLAEITLKITINPYCMNIQFNYDFHSFARHGLRQRIRKFLQGAVAQV